MVNGNRPTTFAGLCRRCILRILIALLFCAVMYTTFVTDFKKPVFQNIISAVLLGVFVFVHYGGLWDMGQIDGSRFKYGAGKKNLLLGLYASLVAAAFYLVLNLILAYSYYKTNSNIIVLFNLINSPVFFICRYLDLTRLGFGVLASAVLPAVIAVTGGVAYVLGFKDISLIMKAVYKK